MAPIQGDGRAQLVEAELVEQGQVGARIEGLSQFVERLDLDLHRHAGPAPARSGDRGANRSCGCDVVLLDEDAVVETHPVVAAAGAVHGVLLGAPQARNGLARVEDPARQPGDRLCVTARDGCRAGQRLQEVERRAFPGQQGARRSGEPAQELAGFDRGAFPGLPFHHHGGVELTKDLVEPGLAADHGSLPGDYPGASCPDGRHQRRRQVATADVLGEGTPDLVDEILGQRGGCHPVRRAGRASPRSCTGASGSTARSSCGRRAVRSCAPVPSPRRTRAPGRGSSSGLAR